MTNKFIKHTATDGSHYFTLIAGNGEVIATSEMYRTKAGRDRGIRSVKANAGRYETLSMRVEKWAKDKGILDNATLVTQAQKTKEEAAELALAAMSKDKEGYADALGDVLVTIIIGANMSGNNLMDCLEDVLDIIEKRTGVMHEGQFIKDK
jgi:uncharacterized protein YegP (UPF0339 family)/NTP pyrophosphatase (non-canonical NTP hydrolase)